MDRTLRKELWAAAGAAPAIMLLANMIIRVANIPIPRGTAGWWLAGIIVDLISLTLLTWTAKRRRKHPEEALIALPGLGWLCYLASASLWPLPLFLPIPVTEVVPAEVVKLSELALLTGVHVTLQFTIPARIIRATPEEPEPIVV